METLIQFKQVNKSYNMGSKLILAADHIDFLIQKGEFVVILGPSGAGKSTILNLLGGMDLASSGEIIVNGETISRYQDHQLTAYRAEHVGFVFQFYNLIPTLTVLENVSLIKEVAKNALDAKHVLDAVGLREHLHKFPAQLSGGEQQRVSIARALCKIPTMLLCDEPTGALDSETGIVILELLQKMSHEQGKTVIIVTHNAALAETADRVIYIRNGKITQIQENSSPLLVQEVSW